MKQFNNMVFIFSSIISTLFLLTACSKQEIQFQENETYSACGSLTTEKEETKQCEVLEEISLQMVESVPAVIESQVMTESPIEEETTETLKISINDWGNISKEKEGEYYTLTSGLLKAYTEKMFLELCCAPKKIEYCYDKISQCGVEKFKQIEWACDNSRINFNDAETEWGEVLEEIKIAGRTKVVSHYIYGNEKRAEDNWQIIFSWIYNTDTGIFDITDIIMEKADVERAQINILVPQKNMSEKEIALFTEFLFLYCCQYPKLIEENNKVFDTESIDRLKMVDWYYEEPEKVYDWAESSGSWAENTYKGRTQIDSQYTFNDIDFGQFQKRNNIQNPDYYSELEARYSSPAFCWRVSVSWVYNKESGIVSVDDIKLLPTLAY